MERYNKSLTASNYHLAGMCLNVGGLHHLYSFGCHTQSPPLPRETQQLLVRPSFVAMATGQTRGGVTVFHLVAPAAPPLLLWHVWSVSLSLSLHLSLSLSRYVRLLMSILMSTLAEAEWSVSQVVSAPCNFTRSTHSLAVSPVNPL